MLRFTGISWLECVADRPEPSVVPSAALSTEALNQDQAQALNQAYHQARVLHQALHPSPSSRTAPSAAPSTEPGVSPSSSTAPSTPTGVVYDGV
jgi:hypothetical protein